MYKNQQQNYQFTRRLIEKTNFNVSQGSVLGPILFLLYVNDFPCSSNFYTTLFADDTNLLFEHGSRKTLQSKVSHEMIKIENWMKSNELTMNYKKSCFMIICKNSVNADDVRLTIKNN